MIIKIFFKCLRIIRWLRKFCSMNRGVWTYLMSLDYKKAILFIRTNSKFISIKYINYIVNIFLQFLKLNAYFIIDNFKYIMAIVRKFEVDVDNFIFGKFNYIKNYLIYINNLVNIYLYKVDAIIIKQFNYINDYFIKNFIDYTELIKNIQLRYAAIVELNNKLHLLFNEFFTCINLYINVNNTRSQSSFLNLNIIYVFFITKINNIEDYYKKIIYNKMYDHILFNFFFILYLYNNFEVIDEILYIIFFILNFIKNTLLTLINEYIMEIKSINSSQLIYLYSAIDDYIYMFKNFTVNCWVEEIFNDIIEYLQELLIIYNFIVYNCSMYTDFMYLIILDSYASIDWLDVFFYNECSITNIFMETLYDIYNFIKIIYYDITIEYNYNIIKYFWDISYEFAYSLFDLILSNIIYFFNLLTDKEFMANMSLISWIRDDIEYLLANNDFVINSPLSDILELLLIFDDIYLHILDVIYNFFNSNYSDYDINFFKPSLFSELFIEVKYYLALIYESRHVNLFWDEMTILYTNIELFIMNNIIFNDSLTNIIKNLINNYTVLIKLNSFIINLLNFFDFYTISYFIFILLTINQINSRIYIYQYININLYIIYIYIISYYIGAQQIAFFLILAEIPIVIYLCIIILDYKFYFFKNKNSHNIYFLYFIFVINLFFIFSFNYEYIFFYEDYQSYDYNSLHNNDLFGLYYNLYINSKYHIYLISVFFLIITILLNYFFFIFKNFKKLFSLNDVFNKLNIIITLSFNFLKSKYNTLNVFNFLNKINNKLFFFKKKK